MIGIITLLNFKGLIAQKWYKQNMEIETIVADTSLDISRLQKSERILSRLAYSLPKEWLPPYYVAFENLKMAELYKESGKEINSDFLSKAYDCIAKTDSLSKGNIEVKILKCYWALLKRDSILLENLNSELVLLLPNPRAYYVMALYAQSKAQIKIRDTYLEEILKKCPSGISEGSYEPHWGCFQAERLKKESKIK